MLTRRRETAILSAFFLLLFLSSSSFAIPAFSRQYGTSCSTCHLDFPKLNDFGKAFKDAGFKFPKDDETFVKIPPVMLGSPAQKELWPHTIWPGTIPGIPQIGFRYNTFFQVVSQNRNNFSNLQNPGDPTAGFIPRTDFQSGLFSVFMAGNFGSDIAFWVDDDISVGGSAADGGLGDGYLKFINIGRFLKLPTDALSLRVGQFELDLPFSPARTWNLSGWDIYDQSNIGLVNSTFGTPTVNNAFALSNAAQGVEFSGGHTYRGYHYSLAIVNQNTGGTPAGGVNVPPVVTYTSDSSFKDIYGRLSYRFNLERDRASRDEIQAAGTTGPQGPHLLKYRRSLLLRTLGTAFSGTGFDGNSGGIDCARTLLPGRRGFQLQLPHLQPVRAIPLWPRPESAAVGPDDLRPAERVCRRSGGEIQWRFPGSRLSCPALADDHHALG